MPTIQRQIEQRQSQQEDKQSVSVSSSSTPFQRAKQAIFNHKAALIALGIGQLQSLCFSGANVSANKLSLDHSISVPTVMIFTHYILLSLVFLPVLIYQQHRKPHRPQLADSNLPILQLLRKHGKSYLAMAVCDVGGTYFLVKAYQYTNILSVTLLDSWSIPVCVALGFFFLGTRLRWLQIAGVLSCLAFQGVLVGLDARRDSASGEDSSAPNPILGDVFCVVGATFMGISNVIQEHLVSTQTSAQVLGLLGALGSICAGIVLAAFGRVELGLLVRGMNGAIAALIAGYHVSLFLSYVAAPHVLRRSSATFLNLSLLTSDFYSLFFGIFLCGLRMHRLYPLVFVGVVTGIVLFNIGQKPKKSEDESTPETTPSTTAPNST
ncbi:DUF914-domain-containing protein [Ramicandelaber brevisporus]|nr:DUF914-domain-containing protein [Ramicandelaber brevisporus]